MEWQKDILFAKAQQILKEAEKLGASQAEVTIVLADTALTRLANSIIDQNVSDRRSMVSIHLYYGKQKGSVSVEVFDNESLAEATQTAAKIAKVSPENHDFKSLPSSKSYSTSVKQSDMVSNSTINATPEQRADYAMQAISTAHDVDKRIRAVAGAISHAVSERVVANSLGIEAYRAGTRSSVALTILAEDENEETAGWAQDIQKGFGDLHIEEVAQKAAKKAADGFGMKVVEPGDYEIVLEPAAVGGWGFFLSWFGFSARAYQDYVSFLRDRIGEKLFSEKFSMWDDGLDTRLPSPSVFDGEGVPKSKVDLVRKGVVKNILYDSLTAGKDGVESTGHNVKGRGMSMPFANHLIMGEGDSSLDEMISETKNGILVTHFHYQNAVDPTKGMFTGLTRDGAWMIKNGEIQFPLKTLRYTDAAPRFLKEIDLVGQYPKLRDSASLVPPMKLPSFKISGSSEQ